MYRLTPPPPIESQMPDVYTTDVITEDDFVFTYNLVCKRLKDPKSHIKYITSTKIPTLDEHIDCVKNNFLLYRIGYVNDTKIGCGCIDRKHFLGMYYDNSAIKSLLKSGVRLDIADTNQKYFDILVSNFPKGTKIFSHVSQHHVLSLRGADKLMERIGILYGHECV
jgi:hypothetical protein